MDIRNGGGKSMEEEGDRLDRNQNSCQPMSAWASSLAGSSITPRTLTAIWSLTRNRMRSSTEFTESTWKVQASCRSNEAWKQTASEMEKDTSNGMRATFNRFLPTRSISAMLFCRRRTRSVFRTRSKAPITVR